MQKHIIICACVLFVLIMLIQGLNCANTHDSVILKPLEEKGDSGGYNIDGAFSSVKEQGKDTVMICNSRGAKAYHRYKCRGLNKCKADIQKTTVGLAGSKGLRACKICYK